MNFRRSFLTGILVAMILAVTIPCINGQEIKLSPDNQRISNNIRYLASEDLEGRKSGERGDSLAAFFILEQFIKAGLEPLYGTGIQSFSLISSVQPGENNHLAFNNLSFKIHTDFLPYSFSANKSLTAPVVFTGYGFTIKTDSLQWNDYEAAEVTGKWVLLLKGDPELDNPQSKFAVYSDERVKVLNALDHGAAGVILVAPPSVSDKDELQNIFYDKNSSTYSIPVIQCTRKVADQLLTGKNLTVKQLADRLNTGRIPIVIELDATLSASAEVIQNKVKSYNVAARLPGKSAALDDEHIVIGAHYDHLGHGGPGSGSRMPDTMAVHYGADDNASGVAALIELACLASKSENNGRSLIFAALGAEEMGLIGATTFTSNPPAELSKIKAMFNLDMLGRLDSLTRVLHIGGTGTSLESEEILVRKNNCFSLNMSPEGSGPSDHAAFYMHDIPVFFVSTGAHEDYHTPGDTFEKINVAGIGKISEYLWEVVKEISNRDDALTFRESGEKVRRSRGTRLKVTLGIMPDFAGQEKSGLRIDAVTTGKPASLAGMKKGDIITAINGLKVGNIYDYMSRLNSLEAGQTISVDVLREGKPVILIVQL